MTMNSFKISAVLAAAALVVALAAPAQAYTVDTLLGGIDSANSGQAYEEAQLELLCGCSVTLLTNVSSGFTVQTDGSGNNYLDVDPNTPGYFLLKFGSPAGSTDMFFFQNIGELTKLVWTDAQVTLAGLPAEHVDSLSHYAITSSTVTTPDGGATLSLLGLALAGIGVARRYMSS